MIDEKVREAINTVNEAAGVKLVKTVECSVCHQDFIVIATFQARHPICRNPKCRGDRKPPKWTPMS